VPLERRPAAAAPVASVPGSELQQVTRNLRQVQEALARLERRGSGSVALPEALARLAERLRSLGLASDLVDLLTQQLLVELDGEALADREGVGERAAALLAERLPACRDIRMGTRRRVVGFIGASGAGKTTAAAKIAAGFSRKRGGRVLLVTADDRRVGALDQARTYGQILGVPLEKAYDEGELTAVLARHPQARLVLVDLAGCGPRDQRERDRQRRLLAAAPADEVQVVLDGTGSLEHMLDQLEAAEVFPERRLLFTKMDEALRPGPAISAAIRSQVATSYLVVGGAVPGEIEAGDLAGLVARAIGVAPADRKGR
jgi:flagellar biosynthesis protein FlhF